MLAAIAEAMLLIVDLDAERDPVEAIRTAAAVAPRPRIVAFVSHVRADLVAAARAAGADEVMARSAFVQRLEPMLAALSASRAPTQPPA
jgi:DNA-binding NarL/FixJ family response regulator